MRAYGWRLLASSSSSSSGSSSGGGRAAAGARGKAAARAKAAAAQSHLPAAHHAPPPRGAKGKAGKAPGAKAAAASVAVKAGGQQPLSDEARRQLDAQLAGLAAHGLVAGSRKPAVRAVGFYIGHAIRPEDVTLLLHALDTRPLAGVVAGDTFRHTDHTVLLLRPAPHTHHTTTHADARAQPQLQQQQPGGGGRAEQGQERAAAACDSRAAGDGGAEEVAGGQPQDSAAAGSCQAVVLHEYGGLAFFNVPPHLMSDLLQRIVRIVIPSTALMSVRAAGGSSSSSSSGSSSGVSSSSGGSSSAGLAAASAGGAAGTASGAVYALGAAAPTHQHRHELLLHSEEEEFVIDEAVDRAPRLQRYIRKDGDAYIISRWDSVNMESVARVLSQSAAIRHYNQICEDMLRLYMALVPPDTPHVEPEGRAARWARLLRSLAAWRQSRSSSSGGGGGHSGQLPLKQLRRMVAESTSIHVLLESSLLGVAEPPTSTWASARHHRVWDVVHDEFELDDRQELLAGKAALIKQSCLDLINAHNDTFAKRSEITIIALIATEIVISLCGLHDVLPLRALLGAASSAAAGH
ncbi:hypothetical protein HXX76_008292 [Chlamydomonas incerta]|uniref:DUF155 domain-containing protein n=1 Tax=Chlamydomonas incerta TaxID=51695 RepID=A0A835STT6_CHLIN|nr:hypothetical protein HXX76_008292 [Chlamydomonas incerta]|eukprot:KAG2433222.1 hypothetical protein HXX76_008292 [Chlamydomonas incerta]